MTPDKALYQIPVNDTNGLKIFHSFRMDYELKMLKMSKIMGRKRINKYKNLNNYRH